MAEIPFDSSVADLQPSFVIPSGDIRTSQEVDVSLSDSADMSQAIFSGGMKQVVEEDIVVFSSGPVVDGLRAGEASSGDLAIIRNHSKSSPEPAMGWHDAGQCPGCNS